MNLDQALHLLAKEPNANLNLANLCLLLAKDEYPQLDIEAYQNEIEAMGREARDLVRGSLRSKTEGLCRYLFHEQGFTGNCDNYYDHRNSYLNDVLDRHTGIPITLSALAMIMGEKTGLKIQGIGLPGHFVAQAIDHRGDSILFDPFHGGNLLELADCHDLILKAIGTPVPLTPDLLSPVTLGEMFQRIMTNLKTVYLRKNDFPRAIRTIHRLRQLNPDNPLEDRDLGTCYMQANQPGRAIAPLESFLKRCPNDASSIHIRKLIQEAKAIISRWN